jgi:superfamily II DNA or RNA helicase
MTDVAEPDDSNIPRQWFDRGEALKVIRYHFMCGTKLIRIATGFFTVRGYNLIRGSARGKQMYILVGVDDPGKDRVRKALVEEIMRDLRTGLDVDRRKAVQELVEKMEGGEFRIIDARAKDHHAKLFLVDDAIALVASSNVSQRGMIDAIEAGTVVDDPAALSLFLKQFDHHFFSPDSIDITQELIEQLRRWLGLSTPWEVYLKTLIAIKSLDDIELQRPSYRKPVGYQTDVIARILRQMDDFDGAILIASTGLGKTVIASDVALRLKQTGLIDNVLVIGPDPVRKEWNDHLRPTGVWLEYYNHLALNAAKLDHNRHAEELVNTLEKLLDDRWLVIIDESHNLRNRYHKSLQNGKINHTEHTAFIRFRQAVIKSQCKVLLLTATPFAKEIENVNNQLFLLPHVGPNRTLFQDIIDDAHAWHINDLSHLKELPPSSVITTPYVAKHYGQKSEDGVFVDFNGQKMYIPRVILYGVRAPMVLEDEMTRILDHRILARKSKRARNQPIENHARIAWGSSPWAIREVIEKSIRSPEDGGYRIKDFILDEETRQELLIPTLERLKQMTYEEDEKLQAVLAALDHRCRNGNKVIVYSERRATIAYLETALKNLRPSIRVASTIELVNTGNYKLKSKKVIRKMLENFAPVSNKNHNPTEEYDVLLATDAYGVGINLQDAETVINYDLAWTPIEPDQRAGRILRFWKMPRSVNLYVFVPTFMLGSIHKHQSMLALSRWEKLTNRHSQARTILEMPTITHQQLVEIDLQSIANGQRITEIGELDLQAVEDRDSSAIFEHTATLVRYRDFAHKIPDDIISAKEYDGKDALIFVLFKRLDKIDWAIYNLSRKKLLPMKLDIEMLRVIQSTETTATAGVDPNTIEQASDRCIQAWCSLTGNSPNEIYRICALYLAPRQSESMFQNLFDN